MDQIRRPYFQSWKSHNSDSLCIPAFTFYFLCFNRSQIIDWLFEGRRHGGLEAGKRCFKGWTNKGGGFHWFSNYFDGSFFDYFRCWFFWFGRFLIWVLRHLATLNVQEFREIHTFLIATGPSFVGVVEERCARMMTASIWNWKWIINIFYILLDSKYGYWERTKQGIKREMK